MFDIETNYLQPSTVGTYKLKDTQLVKDILSAALDSGYSLIGTLFIRPVHPTGSPSHVRSPGNFILQTLQLFTKMSIQLEKF